MGKAIDLTGQRFGRLTVISRAESRNGKTIWHCKCDCGNEKDVIYDNLKRGRTQSCGCIQKEIASNLCKDLSKSERPYEDLTGKRFGNLIVLKRNRNIKSKHIHWECKCDCGNTTTVSATHLRSGHTKSCGCYRSNFEPEVKKHGMSDTRLYKIWQGMKGRCYRNSEPTYKWYGGRGIIVCDEWLHDFQAFYDWAMANGYRDDLTIERKDVDGNYCPENCCWIPLNKQAQNTRATKFLTYNGERKSLSEWSEITGISKGTLHSRIERGWSDKECIETPVKTKYRNKKLD